MPSLQMTDIQTIVEALPDSVIAESRRANRRMWISIVVCSPVVLILGAILFVGVRSVTEFVVIVCVSTMAVSPFTLALGFLSHYSQEFCHRRIAASKPTVTYKDGIVSLSIGDRTSHARIEDCLAWRSSIYGLRIDGRGCLHSSRKAILLRFQPYEAVSRGWWDVAAVGYTKETMKKWEALLGDSRLKSQQERAPLYRKFARGS